MKYKTADAAFAAACREWMKGCTCAPKDNPAECEECTKAFLDAVLSRAQVFDVEIGTNALS